jgi:hypothetical protein
MSGMSRMAESRPDRPDPTERSDVQPVDRRFQHGDLVASTGNRGRRAGLKARYLAGQQVHARLRVLHSKHEAAGGHPAADVRAQLFQRSEDPARGRVGHSLLAGVIFGDSGGPERLSLCADPGQREPVRGEEGPDGPSRRSRGRPIPRSPRRPGPGRPHCSGRRRPWRRCVPGDRCTGAPGWPRWCRSGRSAGPPPQSGLSPAPTGRAPSPEPPRTAPQAGLGSFRVIPHHAPMIMNP